MLAFMAGPTLDTGQQVAYLQLFLLPCLLQILCQALYPLEPRLQKTTYDVFVWGRPWRWLLWGRQVHAIPKRLRKKRKPGVRFWMGAEDDSKDKLRTYLVPLVVSLFKVGCYVESSLRRCRLREILAYCCLRELPSKAASTHSALASVVEDVTATIRLALTATPLVAW
jgi:hypothetical protein